MSLRSRDGDKATSPEPTGDRSRPYPDISLVQLPRLITFAVVPWISRWKCTGGSEVFDTLCDPHNSWPLEVVHHRHEGLEFKGTKIPTHSLAPLSGPRAATGIEISVLGRHLKVLRGSRAANRIKQCEGATRCPNDYFADFHSLTIFTTHPRFYLSVSALINCPTHSPTDWFFI